MRPHDPESFAAGAEMRLIHLVALGLLASSSAFAGPLTGKTLGVVAPNNSVNPSPTALVNESGVEFIGSANGSNVEFDFFESGLLTVTFFDADLNQGGQFTFTDALSEIAPIVDFQQVSGIFIQPSRFSFTENSVSLNLGQTSWGGPFGGSFTARIEFAAVPEPGSVALVGLGLAALAAGRRRRA